MPTPQLRASLKFSKTKLFRRLLDGHFCGKKFFLICRQQKQFISIQEGRKHTVRKSPKNVSKFQFQILKVNLAPNCSLRSQFWKMRLFWVILIHCEVVKEALVESAMARIPTSFIAFSGTQQKKLEVVKYVGPQVVKPLSRLLKEVGSKLLKCDSRTLREAHRRRH